MTMIIVEFSVIPLGTKSTSLSEYVSQACMVVKGSGVKYQITPMGTIIEVETIDRAFEVIKAAHESLFQLGATRVSTSIRIDDRRDKEREMEDKVKSLKV